MTFRIQLLNTIAAQGLAEFPTDHYEISEKITRPHALLLRSHSLHKTAIDNSVLVVVRAGVGVNNIPIDTLTQRGIPVLNTPGANANAVKELVMCALLLASRNICNAWNYTRQLSGDNEYINQQVESNKKRFAGIELPGKTLGVIGLGAVGVKVANAAQALGMHVIGYDPAITVRHAWQLSSAVTQADTLEDIFGVSDFITLHVPLNKHTHHLIKTQSFASMRDGVILLNFARDGIVDNQALLDAMACEKVRSYVCDFPNTLFQEHPQAICLPHLGASTQEAEQQCAIMAAQQIQAYLSAGHISNAINFPQVKLPRTGDYRLSIINENVPDMVAQISTLLAAANINITEMVNKSKNNIAYNLIDLSHPIEAQLLKAIAAIKGVIRVRAIP